MGRPARRRPRAQPSSSGASFAQRRNAARDAPVRIRRAGDGGAWRVAGASHRWHRAAGIELNLFHLVALILAAGLGLDYALFFDHAGDDRAEQLRTLHAIIVCSLTTLLVFSLLALSSIPVLRAIGGTVALGVLFNFALALLVTRQRAPDEAAA